MKECVFCRENRFKKNNEIGFSNIESILYEDDNLFITFDISPLCPGHLLIVSQEHYNSFANAPLEVQHSLKQVLNAISENPFYEDMLFFEHGAVFPGTGGASIDHAHMHVLPLNLDLKKAIEEDSLYSNKIKYSDEVLNSLARKQPYLWVGSTVENSSIYYVNDLTSQYLRKKAMELQNSENYNWKENYNKNENIANIKDFLKRFATMTV